MGVDWGYAGLVGGVGFGMVFALLIILAFVIWTTGVLMSKRHAGQDKAKAGDTDNTKEGA